MNDPYKRTIGELEKRASMFWPADLSARAAEISIIPKLLETQDEFIALLSVPVDDLDALFKIIDTSSVPGNLFVKHLSVLADVGGENLQRFNRGFKNLFPKRVFVYLKNGKEFKYKFRALPIRPALTSSKLHIDGKHVLVKEPLNDLHKDIVALLLYGGNSTDQHAAEILAKCIIGNLLGEPEKLKVFIKQRYIMVSRITAGATSNSLGQIAQDYVKDYLRKKLSIEPKRNGSIPGVTHRDPQTGRPTTFDLVLSKNKRYVAIEISFQVTTNSTIERKAGQARSRYEQVQKAGHKIAYVIDGAGNFQRSSAISLLCSYSDCTVAFSEKELRILCNFIKEHFSL